MIKLCKMQKLKNLTNNLISTITHYIESISLKKVFLNCKHLSLIYKNTTKFKTLITTCNYKTYKPLDIVLALLKK